MKPKRKSGEEKERGRVRAGEGNRSRSTSTSETTTTTYMPKYVTLFLMLCLALYLVYYLTTGLGLMLHMRSATAWVLASLFSLAGMDVVVKGTVLSVNGFTLDIIDECTAVFPAIIYCSCVLAYPAGMKKKSLGILIGVPALYLINLLRIAVLAIVGIHHPGIVEFVHVYLWQGSFIIFVVVLFLVWLKMESGAKLSEGER